jgi:hypothetical protein
MSGMRVVGLLLLGLGLLVVWEVLQGKRPQDHIQQLIDLFGHQHVSGQPTNPGPAFPFGPADRAGSGNLGSAPSGKTVFLRALPFGTPGLKLQPGTAGQ